MFDRPIDRIKQPFLETLDCGQQGLSFFCSSATCRANSGQTADSVVCVLVCCFCAEGVTTAEYLRYFGWPLSLLIPYVSTARPKTENAEEGVRLLAVGGSARSHADSDSEMDDLKKRPTSKLAAASSLLRAVRAGDEKHL